MLLSRGPAPVDLSQDTYPSIDATDSATPYVSEAGYRINSNGYLESRLREGGAGATYSNIELWLESGAAADFDVKVTKTGGTGTIVGMTDATWYNCGTTQNAYISRTTFGTTTWTGTITFRYAGGAEIDSASISMSCTNE